jgi:integrase
MPKKAKELTARAVSELKWDPKNVDSRGNPTPTLRPVGGVSRLYLQCTKSGSRSWIYRYSFGGKRSKMGIGSYTYLADENSEALTLKQARTLAQHYEGLIAQQKDPILERKQEKLAVLAEKAQAITFQEVAEEWIEQQTGTEWKTATGPTRCRQYMRDYAYPLFGSVAILDITYAHIKKMLNQKTVQGKHLWKESNPTGERLRRYVFNIIQKGITNLGKRHSHFNVATYKNNLDVDFSSPSTVHTVEHRPFVHWEDLPRFVEKLIARQDRQPKGGRPDIDCLIFGMLCCTRSKATRYAEWEDIDLDKKVWDIPPHKVGKKTTRNWEVPLHPTAIRILKAQPSARHKTGRIFSTLQGNAFHDKALSTLPPSLGFVGCMHGFRTTMNTWAKKERWDKDTRELMMQHLEESSTHAAYDRDEAMVEDRREIVNGYEKYAFSKVRGKGKVVPTRKKAS